MGSSLPWWPAASACSPAGMHANLALTMPAADPCVQHGTSPAGPHGPSRGRAWRQQLMAIGVPRWLAPSWWSSHWTVGLSFGVTKCGRGLAAHHALYDRRSSRQHTRDRACPDIPGPGRHPAGSAWPGVRLLDPRVPTVAPHRLAVDDDIVANSYVA